LTRHSDIDVTPDRDPRNLQRLSQALSDLDARIRVDDLEEGLPFAHDADSLAGMDMLNLTCLAATSTSCFPRRVTGRI
jgi:hypothetical protein